MDLNEFIFDAIVDGLVDAQLGEVLVAQCKRKMDESNDGSKPYKPLAHIESTCREPDRIVLTKKGKRKKPGKVRHVESYRYGGKPLLDTRTHIYNRLRGEVVYTRGKVRISVIAPKIALMHQKGFWTDPPIYIPLNRKAARTMVKGQEPPKSLIEGCDYVVRNRPTWTPARRIFNPTFDDLKEQTMAVVDAMIQGAGNG